MRLTLVPTSLLASALLAGCSMAQGDTDPVSVAPATSAQPVAREDMAVREARELSFSEWRSSFRARALAAGIDPALHDALMADVRPSSRVRELDGSQPEFVRPIWQYLERAVSDDRVRIGRSRADQYAGTLTAIEQRYGTDKEVVLAIWGLETGYGAVRGNTSVVQALATLAHEGRRRDFAERELIDAMRIVQEGDASPADLRGSWAGAMGHTQFMPSSFHAYAQDFDGDGRRNIWSSDPTDALASTAHYLRGEGWTPGQPWGFEVSLPANFNWILVDRFVQRPTTFWQQAGVTPILGGALPDHGPASLVAPMGAGGPVFLTYPNFEVIKSYNNSTAYALAIGLIGDQVYGGQGVIADWPQNVLPLTRADRRELQERLTALGFDTEGADGFVGPNTERAIRQFQQANGLIPDGTATDRLLDRVRAAG